jgi:hypothetical protein
VTIDTVICPFSSKTMSSSSVRFEYSFASANYGAIAHYLSLCRWNILFCGCISVNDYWKVFQCVLSELVDKFVPVRAYNQRPRDPGKHSHLPKHLRRLVLSKRRAWHRHKTRPTVVTKAAFNLASRRCRLEVHAHQARREQALLASSSRKFYSYVTNQLRPQCNNITLQINGIMTSTPEHVCSCLCDEFARNFSAAAPATAIPHQDSFTSSSPCLQSVNVDFITV